MNTLQPSDCMNCSPDERKTQKAPCSNPNEKKGLQEEKVQYNLFYDRSISDYIIREVKPYLIVYDTFAKGRWLGRKLIDILSVEYGGFPIEYWQNGIKRGFVKVNNANVTEDYIVKNADRIYHKAHRHEPMVYGEIQFVGETESLLAVSKPASIPMHPCGNYRHNSLEMILKNEPIVPNQPNLYIVHRLDRLTSGLIVLAKDKNTAAKVSGEIRKKSTQKIYLARVKGRFPNRIEQLKRWETVDLAPYQDDYEKEKEKERWRNDPRNDNSAGAVKKNNKNNNNNNNNSNKSNKKRKFQSEEENGEGTKVEEGEGDGEGSALAPGVVRRVESFEEVIAAPLTGYVVNPVDYESPRNQRYRTIFPHADSQEYWVSCSLDVISFREGIHACCSDGKPSLSRFRLLAYDEALIECQPYTGRTHQLRLHLWLCGNSIANDPCYGGELFYGNQTRRDVAIEAMKVLEQNRQHRPLSKMPHLHQIASKEDELLLALQRNEQQRVEMEKLAQKAQLEKDGGRDFKVEPYPDETEDEFLVRTCRSCREDNDLVRLEHVVHCDGIWLHA
eukprot:CAMPEP_0173164294 /NCGR_PEP_ID=MMETSP1105-20130129/20480_1 /TAXON_ID=2985 /ORGANISM="Ochromonas sp., Strain BG-1" /LENGTH=558 /DNA_ID=CAMNT_0014084613 /DNA_START=154 /DNA_END=1826 /DNA_ORIENTATION=+